MTAVQREMATLLQRYLGLDAAPSYLRDDVEPLVSRLVARIQALEAERDRLRAALQTLVTNWQGSAQMQVEGEALQIEVAVFGLCANQVLSALEAPSGDSQ